jgi:nucleoid-associated protein YgaU
VAIAYYGDGNRWTDIAEANDIRDPRTLDVGDELAIPGAVT